MVTIAVTMRFAQRSPDCRHGQSAFKILIEFDTVKFDENLRCISVDFAQKPCFNANGSFKAVCYG